MIAVDSAVSLSVQQLSGLVEPLDCEVATPQLKRAEDPELFEARSLGVLR